jgi:F-type H+-transporting ATPase subunit b
MPILAATSEEGGGSFLVTPNVGLMIWTLLAFGITLWILWKLAFPRIGEALDRRQKAIEESIDTAERTKVEADELLQEYRERLKEAREQADEIVARARKAGDNLESESKADALRQREELMEQTRRDIQAETNRAIQEIRNEVADLTVLATEKVTRKTLTDDDQRRLVDEALGELPDLVAHLVELVLLLRDLEQRARVDLGDLFHD